MDLPDHAAVLLRGRGGLPDVVATRHQLGRLAAEALQQAVPPGVLLPRVLGDHPGIAVSDTAPACLPARRRDQHSTAVVPRRLCAGAGGDAAAVSDHHDRAPGRRCDRGLRGHRGHRRGPAALARRRGARLSQPRGLAHSRHVRRCLPTPLAFRARRAGHRRGTVRRRHRAASVGTVRAEPGRHRRAAAAQHEPPRRCCWPVTQSH